MQVRPYQPSDEGAVLALLRLNIPHFFAEAEADDFKKYLASEREDYFVMEQNEQIIGAGGINYFPTYNKARISWDFFHPDFHGKGFGSQLLQHRIEHVKNLKQYSLLEVRTSQLVYKFYQKNGFVLRKKVANYWAEGFDLYRMEMNLIGNQFNTSTPLPHST